MSLIILGAGGMAQTIFGVTKHERMEVAGFVDETISEPTTLFGLPVFTSIPDIEAEFICGIGNPVVKEKFEQVVLDRLVDPIIHSAAYLGYLCEIEKGVVINANCALNIDVKVGRSTSVNPNCTIGHNCRIGRRCHISGGVVLSGNTVLEDDVYIGSNATTIPKVHVGRGAVIGAGAVVVRDVEPYTIVAGVPARVLRVYKKGDPVSL